MRLPPALLLAAAVALLAASVAAPAQAARPLGLPQGETVLFSVQAEGGTLTEVRGQKDRFTLTLRDVATQGIWFTDRPARQTGSMPIGSFFRSWKKLGFRSDAPNAVIALSGAAAKEDAFAVELGTPRYDARRDTVTFRVRALEGLSPGLAQLAPRLDDGLPVRFGEAALFIDDVYTGASRGSYCGYIAQLDVFPSELRGVSGYYPTDGRILPIMSNQALFALIDNTFGGDGRSNFATPKLAGPLNGLSYQLCYNGIFPSRADDDYDGPAQCDVGTIVLNGMQTFQPAGWVQADGRSLSVARAQRLFAVTGQAFGGGGQTFNVPNIPAPKDLKWWVCANGDTWTPTRASSNTCQYSQVVLFATKQLPPNYMAADGRTLPIASNQVLFSLFVNTFGGDGITTFQLPNIPSPVPGTTYGVCSAGIYPMRD